MWSTLRIIMIFAFIHIFCVPDMEVKDCSTIYVSIKSLLNKIQQSITDTWHITVSQTELVFPSVIFLTMLWKAFAVSDSGISRTQAFPKSVPTLGSMGNTPKNGTFTISARATPPPLLNILVHSVQCGHTKPLIFSIMPKIGIPVFLQKVTSFLTSSIETACGVVTITAPSQLTVFRFSITVICSSEVPKKKESLECT